MKFFLTLALTAVSAVSLFAAAYPRVDISAAGQNKTNKLTPGTVEGGIKVTQQNWGDQATRAYRLTAAGGKALGTEWTNCKFTFTPEADGDIGLAFCGQWAKETANREWIAVSGIKINGELITNGDFVKFTEKDGKKSPAGFWLSAKASYVADGGPGGTGAVIVNHDNRAHHSIKVEAGKPVVVEFMVKAAAK